MDREQNIWRLVLEKKCFLAEKAHLKSEITTLQYLVMIECDNFVT